MRDRIRFVSPDEMTLRVYRCGVSAGDRLRLRRDLSVEDHRGRPTGVVHRAGEVWTVMIGDPTEPGIVWLREPDGERHTWDETLLDWFERLELV